MNVTFKEIAVKLLLFFFFAVLICASETSLYPAIGLFGYVPELMIYFVATVAVFQGAAAGMAAGLISGVLLDGANSVIPIYYSVVYALIGAAIGFFSPYYFQKKFLPVVFWGLLFGFFAQFLRFFIFIYLFGLSGLGRFFVTGVPTLLISALLSPLVILPVRTICRLFKPASLGLFY